MNYLEKKLNKGTVIQNNMLYDIWEKEMCEWDEEFGKRYVEADPADYFEDEEPLYSDVKSFSTASLIRVLKGVKEMADKIYTKNDAKEEKFDQFLVDLSEQIELIRENLTE